MWRLQQYIQGNHAHWRERLVELSAPLDTLEQAAYEVAIAINSPLHIGRTFLQKAEESVKQVLSNQSKIMHAMMKSNSPFWGALVDFESHRHLSVSMPSMQFCAETRSTCTIANRVEAIVTFGRPDRVRILDRYLRRNLVSAGGIVSKVHFVVLRAIEEDIIYLQSLMEEVPEYNVPSVKGRYLAKMYSVATDPEVIYIKLDDDIVYIGPDTFEVLAEAKLREPDCSFVSANVVNHAILGALHDEMGAMREEYRPIFDGWKAVIEKKAQSDCLWRYWECGEWVHRSFLHHINRGTEDIFKFSKYNFHTHGYGGYKSDDSPWITPFKTSRWSINFFAFTVHDLEGIDWDGLDEDDESQISYMQPHQLQIPACAMGKALAVHFSYTLQEDGLLGNTTLLDEYDKLSLRLPTLNGYRWSV